MASIASHNKQKKHFYEEHGLCITWKRCGTARPFSAARRFPPSPVVLRGDPRGRVLLMSCTLTFVGPALPRDWVYRQAVIGPDTPSRRDPPPTQRSMAWGRRGLFTVYSATGTWEGLSLRSVGGGTRRDTLQTSTNPAGGVIDMPSSGGGVIMDQRLQASFENVPLLTSKVGVST